MKNKAADADAGPASMKRPALILVLWHTGVLHDWCINIHIILKYILEILFTSFAMEMKTFTLIRLVNGTWIVILNI